MKPTDKPADDAPRNRILQNVEFVTKCPDAIKRTFPHAFLANAFGPACET
jgi:hypothetical protein